MGASPAGPNHRCFQRLTGVNCLLHLLRIAGIQRGGLVLVDDDRALIVRADWTGAQCNTISGPRLLIIKRTVNYWRNCAPVGRDRAILALPPSLS